MTQANGNGSNGKLLVEADMDAAERRHFRRHSAEAMDGGPLPFEQLNTMPFDDAARAFISERGEDEIGDYELGMMYRGYRLAFNRILEAGVTDEQLGRRVRALGRQICHPVVCELSMTEEGRLSGESKAIVSYRGKRLSAELRRAGLKGFRLPGQKTPQSTAAYHAVQLGNRNRKGGKRRERQGSFLRRLAQSKKAKQGSFMKKLKVKGHLKI
jgi:hypothetical protein